jgi:hypothetical protein
MLYACSLHENLLDFTLKYAKDTESEGNVKDDARKSRLGSRVESHEAFVLHDRASDVNEALILASVDTLKTCLDNIDRVVGHDGAESGETARNKIAQDLHTDIVLKEL